MASRIPARFNSRHAATAAARPPPRSRERTVACRKRRTLAVAALDVGANESRLPVRQARCRFRLASLPQIGNMPLIHPYRPQRRRDSARRRVGHSGNPGTHGTGSRLPRREPSRSIGAVPGQTPGTCPVRLAPRSHPLDRERTTPALTAPPVAGLRVRVNRQLRVAGLLQRLGMVVVTVRV